MPKVRCAECDDSPERGDMASILVVTLWEGWIQVCRLTGIAQRRLDSCIHLYFHGFCFIAACHGNKDKSYSTEPKNPIHPIHKSECHLTSASFFLLQRFPLLATSGVNVVLPGRNWRIGASLLGRHARLACAQERNNSTPVGDTDTHAANGPAAMGNSNPSHLTSKVQRTVTVASAMCSPTQARDSRSQSQRP